MIYKLKQSPTGPYNNQTNNKNMEYQPRKLSFHQAAKIRELYDKGATQNQLARYYEVSKQTIKSIVQGKTYVREYTKFKNN